MLFDGPARKAEERYGKHEDDDDEDGKHDDDEDHNADDEDGKHDDEDHNDDDDEDDHLCLSAGRWTGLTGRTLTGSCCGWTDSHSSSPPTASAWRGSR